MCIRDSHHRGQVQAQRAHQVQSGGRGAGGGDGQRQPPVNQRTEMRRRGGTDSALGIQQRAVQIRDVQCGQKNASRGKNDLIVPQKNRDEKRLAPHKRMCYHEMCIRDSVCGVKQAVVGPVQDAMPEGVEFIASHPMAGKEVSGVEYADSAIFRQANFIICLLYTSRCV